MKPRDAERAAHPRGLVPPKFGLKTLLTLIGVFCIVFASFSAGGPVVGSAVVLSALATLAHVAGNVIGTQLRNKVSDRHCVGAAQSVSVTPRRPEKADFAPTTKLGQRIPLGWYWVIATAVGSVGSAIAGVVLLVHFHGASVTLPTMTFAGLAAGVLGGIFTFGMFCLLQVLCGAMWQAHWHGQTKGESDVYDSMS